jgi:hypothetical protein
VTGFKLDLRTSLRPRPKLAGYAGGVILILIGTAGLAGDAVDTEPPAWAVWYASVVLAHDLLLVPLVLAVSVLLGRLPVRAPWRAVLKAGLFVGGCVSLVAVPLVSGYGRKPANPSILPLDYPRNLLVVLAAIAAGTAVAGVLAAFGPSLLRRRTRTGGGGRKGK